MRHLISPPTRLPVISDQVSDRRLRGKQELAPDEDIDGDLIVEASDVTVVCTSARLSVGGAGNGRSMGVMVAQWFVLKEVGNLLCETKLTRLG